MRTLNTLCVAAMAATLSFTPLQADQWNKKTIITIDAPMQLPTTTLQPGTYTLKLLDSQSDRHIVTVWDEDGMHLVTTLLAIPNYRLQPTGKSAFGFWETPAGQPRALRAWFYPGDNFGQEFAYPKSMADNLAKANHVDVPAMSQSDEQKVAEAPTAPQPVETSAITATESAPAPEAPVKAEAAPVVPEPVAAPEPAPVQAAAEPTPAPVTELPAALPATAGVGNEVLLAGVIFLLAAALTYRPKSLRG